jgi:hypothetical protein
MWKTEYGFVEGKKRFQLCFVRNSPVEEPEKQLGLGLLGHLWTDTKDALCDNYHIVNATAELVSYRRIGRHTRS